MGSFSITVSTIFHTACGRYECIDMGGSNHVVTLSEIFQALNYCFTDTEQSSLLLDVIGKRQVDQLLNIASKLISQKPKINLRSPVIWSSNFHFLFLTYLEPVLDFARTLQREEIVYIFRKHEVCQQVG